MKYSAVLSYDSSSLTDIAKDWKMKCKCAMLLLIFSTVNSSYAWENVKTHPALTEQAINASGTDAYVKQLGLSSGLSTQLYWDFPLDIERRVRGGSADPDSKTRSVLNWIKLGSIIEDVNSDFLGAWIHFLPSWRPRHHFYDPYRNAGLDNNFDHPDWKLGGWVPLGQSALDWAFSGTADQAPTTNNNTWYDARQSLYNSVILTKKTDRDANLAMACVSLGCVLHLLEDMGVPAHTRNDFLYGHYRGLFIGGTGNPLEGWMEKQVGTNGGRIPSQFSGGTVSISFPRARYFWDTDTYTGQTLTGGQQTPNTWGLAERTNYQFLSVSTMFIADTNGTKYYFPNPAYDKTNAASEPYKGYNYRYVYGYGINHLAKKTYIAKYAEAADIVPPSSPQFDVLYTVSDDSKIYSDYAKITIPRTISYATGLANYFFRGQISAEQTGLHNGAVEITVTNNSNRSGTPMVLKGGNFTIYWDDQDSNRTPIPGTVIVYKPHDVTIWNSDTILQNNDSTKIEFTPVTPPVNKSIKQYVLVYQGPINDQNDPNNTDLGDNQPLAVTTFSCSVPGNPCQYCNNADCNTPSIIYVQVSGFTPCRNCLPVSYQCNSYWGHCGSENKDFGASINGTYPCIQTSYNQCTYQYWDPNRIAYVSRSYENNSCEYLQSGPSNVAAPSITVWLQSDSVYVSVSAGANGIDKRFYKVSGDKCYQASGSVWVSKTTTGCSDLTYLGHPAYDSSNADVTFWVPWE
jgi:hypothetical protein